MSRTLSDDFEDDLGGDGSLDLEKGSSQVGSGVSSCYDGGGNIDFDDELTGDDGPGLASLELDIPGGGRTGPGAQPNLPAVPAPSTAASGGPAVPDLALDAPPARAPQPPQSSGSLAARAGGAPQGASAGAHPAHPAPPPQPPPAPSSSQALPPSPPGESNPDGAGSASSSGQHLPPAQVAPAKPSAAQVIAKYPPAPDGLLAAPMYAVRVVLRQLELRTDLESLRRRRSPDVPLYEAALTAYEPKTFRLGMAINIAALAVATFIFFLPVIIRFMRD